MEYERKPWWFLCHAIYCGRKLCLKDNDKKAQHYFEHSNDKNDNNNNINFIISSTSGCITLPCSNINIKSIFPPFMSLVP